MQPAGGCRRRQPTRRATSRAECTSIFHAALLIYLGTPSVCKNSQTQPGAAESGRKNAARCMWERASSAGKGLFVDVWIPSGCVDIYIRCAFWGRKSGASEWVLFLFQQRLSTSLENIFLSFVALSFGNVCPQLVGVSGRRKMTVQQLPLLLIWDLFCVREREAGKGFTNNSFKSGEWTCMFCTQVDS